MKLAQDSRGHISLSNKSMLTLMHQLCQPRTKLRHFIQNISKISLLASYSIYLSRNEINWTSVDLLKPRLCVQLVTILYTTMSYTHVCYVRVSEKKCLGSRSAWEQRKKLCVSVILVLAVSASVYVCFLFLQ